MQTSALPSRMPTPFADTGTKNTIPVASQVGITAGAASFTTGFPPLTMTPVAAGGVPPFGADFNGILNAITQAVRWTNAGMAYPFDTTFSTSIGGYPKGALVPNSAFTGYWYNTIEQNTAAPEAADASTTGWVPLMNTGFTSVALTSSSVTLTSLQAAKDRMVLSGALTANVSLYLPAWTRRWTIINNCTGSYTVTASTPNGTGVVIPTGIPVEVYGDGANITLNGVLPSGVATAANDVGSLDDSTKAASTGWVRRAMSNIALTAGFNASFGTNGFIKLPSWLGSFILQWGTATAYNAASLSVTYPLAFPSACFGIVQSIYNDTSGSTDAVRRTTSSTPLTTATFRLTNADGGTAVSWLSLGR